MMNQSVISQRAAQILDETGGSLLRILTRLAAREDTTVITVRLPRSLHRLLIARSHGAETSLNKLCQQRLAACERSELARRLAELDLAADAHDAGHGRTSGSLAASGPAVSKTVA